MRFVSFVMLLMAATWCRADSRAFELSLDLTIDGRHIGSPRVVLEDGVKASIALEDKFIDVVARASPEFDGIDISFWIGETKDGQRKIVATPSVVTHPGQPAKLKVSVDDPASEIKQLTVVVTARKHVP